MPDLSPLAVSALAAPAGGEPGEVDHLVRLVSRHDEAVGEPPSGEAVSAAPEG